MIFNRYRNSSKTKQEATLRGGYSGWQLTCDDHSVHHGLGGAPQGQAAVVLAPVLGPRRPNHQLWPSLRHRHLGPLLVFLNTGGDGDHQDRSVLISPHQAASPRCWWLCSSCCSGSRWLIGRDRLKVQFNITRTSGRSAPIFSSVSLRSMNGSNLKIKPTQHLICPKKTLVLACD